MKAFTIQNTMEQVLTDPRIQPYSRFMIYTPGANPMQEEMNRKPIESMREIGWSPEAIADGLTFLAEAVETGRMEQYFIYDEDACTDEPQKKNVNLMRLLPETIDPERPYIVLCAGGAYMSVCTAVEALPTAVHMVEAGYQVFLMTYRVQEEQAVRKSLDDLYHALRFIEAHKDQFTITDADVYAIGGFSAGANLISNWGAANVGYKKYGFAKPKVMFPIYTFIDLKAEAGRDEYGGLVRLMFSPEFTQADVDEFNVIDHLDAAYPPCYIVCGKDDATVPPRNSEGMEAGLRAAGVPVALEEGDHAPHGFGDGTGTDVEGWPERALKFMESL
ncbi:MAG: alpha/beta hydrolase [Clostridiales bacterium]|nr:alpha/beta hydrolase [Clostridiales bacterium]